MRSRMLAAAAVLAVPLSLGVSPSMVSAEVQEDPSIAAAVRSVNDPTVSPTEQVRAVPTGFAYRPAEGPGYAVNPHGGCSSLISLPIDFEDPCKAHDLGYDLLRHADSSGHRLGGWARREIDEAFARRLRTVCAARPVSAQTWCGDVAAIAITAVRVNTWRQHYGPPQVEDTAELVWSWASLGGRL